jgi:hypothetical protein
MTQVSVTIQRLTAQPERKISYYTLVLLFLEMFYCLEELGKSWNDSS